MIRVIILIEAEDSFGLRRGVVEDPDSNQQSGNVRRNAESHNERDAGFQVLRGANFQVLRDADFQVLRGADYQERSYR